MKSISLVIALLFLIPAHGNDFVPLETVSYVDLNRYLGTWYEIARFDHSFQRKCGKSWAEYSMRDDGDIKVINRCLSQNTEGDKKIKEVVGRAWVVDKKTNSKLKVQFFLSFFRFNFLAGDYWIIDLDEKDYSYAVVGDSSRKYLWILSRSPAMPPDLYEELVARAREKDFETLNLIKTGN